MRVPFLSSNQSFINQVNSLNQKQINLQKQVSRGQRFTQVSEDPAAVGRALSAGSEKAKLQTYDRNLVRAEFVGNFTLETLEQFKGVADSITNLTNTNDGLTASGDLKARGLNTNQLVSQGIQILNTQLSGDYLFAGANVDETPFVAKLYTEFLEDDAGNFVDLQGNLLGPTDPPVESVYRDANGDIVFEPILDRSNNTIAEGTYVDPITGNQTDASGNALPGPVALTAGIDFNTGAVVARNTASGAWENVLDSEGNTIVPPVGPDISGTGFITTTRTIARELIGQASHVEYTGSTDPANDVSFRVGENSSVSPFSRGAANEEYGTLLNDMIAFRDAYMAEDIDSVNSIAPRFNESQELVLFGMVEMGSKLQNLEVMGRINEVRFNELETAVSNELDVNIAEAIVQLNSTQTAYEAALSSGARILNLSLLDYLG